MFDSEDEDHPVGQDAAKKVVTKPAYQLELEACISLKQGSTKPPIKDDNDILTYWATASRMWPTMGLLAHWCIAT